MKVAKANGWLQGKWPRLTVKQAARLLELHDAGEYTMAEMDESFSMSRSFIHRAAERGQRKQRRYLLDRCHPQYQGDPRPWGQDLRLSISVKQGTVTTSLMLRKLGNYPRQTALALSLRQAERIEGTLSSWTGSKASNCADGSMPV